MNIHNRWHRLATAGMVLLGVAACSPAQPAVPRPTSATIIDITPAATQNVDATVTAYALQLVPSPTPAGLYKVQTGDTLSSLASDFGTTVEELMAANGLTDQNAIQVGQSLLIPSLISSTLDLGTPLPGTTQSITDTGALTGTNVLTGTAVATPTPTISTP